MSYKYRLYPNKTQEIALSDMLGAFCELYNAALENRINAYRHGVSIRCYDQIVTLPEIRRDLPHQGRWSATAQQQVLRRLDKTYQAFFGRVKRGGKAGFPRFRARDRYHAADFRVGDGLNICKSGKIRFVGIPGEIKVCWHRELPSIPKSAILSRNGSKWYVIFHVEVAAAERASPESVGIDLGLTAFVALSNGETIARPNYTKKFAGKLRKAQRALARCQRRSKSRRKAKARVTALQTQLGAARHDFLHKQSRALVNRFGRIGLEKLNIKGLAGGMLAKHVNDASWGQFVQMVHYKAASAGCECVEVDPRGTSQTCPECGQIAKKTLAERMHRCDCGCTLDRDVAAAKVVHFRAFGFRPGAGLGELSQRVAA